MNFFYQAKLKAQIALQRPSLVLPYLHYNFLKVLSEPAIVVHGRRLVGFRTFSDFHHYRSTIASVREELFIKDFLSNGPHVCVDVGANIGQFAALLASAENATIHCFEPHPYSFKMLKGNLSGGRFILNNVALSDRECHSRFTDNDHSTHINRLVTDAEGESAGSGILLDVECTTLDGYLSERGVEQVRFLKIDTEGAEALVLSGCREYLARQRVDALLVEVCPEHLGRFGFVIKDLRDRLAPYGYFPNGLDERGGTQRIEWSDLETVQLANVIFTPAALSTPVKV